MMRKIAGLIGSTASLALLACLSAKAEGMYPDSFVNIHGNISSIGVSNDYYDDYGYYNSDYSSNSASGGGGGAAVRYVLPGGLMFDAVYNTDKSNVDDGNIRINQGSAGIGYLGHMGRSSTWYAEAMFATFQPRVYSNFICGGTCASTTYNGGGIKAGFMWPFAGQWYGTLDFGFAGLQGPSGSDSLVQGMLGGSVGYKFTPNFGMNIGIVSNAWEDSNTNGGGDGTALSVVSVQAGLSLHF
jgi:hypothetical protein